MRQSVFGSLARALALAGMLVPLASAHASASIPLAVSPLVVRLEPASGYGAFDVFNRGEEATGVEIEFLRVKWVNGKEEYEPTDQFAFSPLAFRLQPSKNRLVRFHYEGAHGDAEGMYRMFIRQLPGPGEQGQVNLVLNIGLPVFVSPTTPRPALALAGTELRNTGNVSLTVSRLEGAGCPPDATPVQTRVAPQQKVVLKADLTRCATAAQTDRGLIPLATP